MSLFALAVVVFVVYLLLVWVLPRLEAGWQEEDLEDFRRVAILAFLRMAHGKLRLATIAYGGLMALLLFLWWSDSGPTGPELAWIAQQLKALRNSVLFLTKGWVPALIFTLMIAILAWRAYRHELAGLFLPEPLLFAAKWQPPFFLQRAGVILTSKSFFKTVQGPKIFRKRLGTVLFFLSLIGVSGAVGQMGEGRVYPFDVVIGGDPAAGPAAGSGKPTEDQDGFKPLETFAASPLPQDQPAIDRKDVEEVSEAVVRAFANSAAWRAIAETGKSEQEIAGFIEKVEDPQKKESAIDMASRRIERLDAAEQEELAKAKPKIKNYLDGLSKAQPSDKLRRKLIDKALDPLLEDMADDPVSSGAVKRFKSMVRSLFERALENWVAAMKAGAKPLQALQSTIAQTTLTSPELVEFRAAIRQLDEAPMKQGLRDPLPGEVAAKAKPMADQEEVPAATSAAAEAEASGAMADVASANKVERGLGAGLSKADQEARRIGEARAAARKPPRWLQFILGRL